MIIIDGKKYREVRYGTKPFNVNVNGITVVNDTLTNVNLTLVDQNGDDVPFTQTGTELEIPDATITLDSEPFLTVASGSTTDITLEDEDGNPVNPIGGDGSTIIVPTNFELEIYFTNQFQQSITLNSQENNIVNINL